MYANQVENLDAIKLLKILLYTHKILKKYNYLNVKFLTRNVRYLNIKSFQKEVYGNQDHNATLIIPFKLALRLSLAPGCWVSAKFLSRDFNHRQTQLRWIKVIIDYKLKSSDQCFVSLNLYHNLKEALSSQNIAVELKSEALIFNLYLITRLFAIWNSRGGRRSIFSKYKSNLLPKFTSKVNLSFAHPSNLNSKEVENILQYHFSIPRYLHKQDIICVPVPPLQNLPSEMFESLSQAEFLYFIVNSFDESGQSPTSGYLVSKEKTALFLSGVKSTRIPYLMGNANTADENTIPCLKSVFNKVCSIFESSQPLWLKEYTQLKSNLNEDEKLQIARERQEESKDFRNRRKNSNNSLFDYNGQLLLIGPPGSGKVKMIKMLAEKFSYQIKWIDCLSLKGDTSSATEGKINIAFSNLPPYIIIVLTRIGSLSEDRDGHNDPRAFSALRERFKIFSPMMPRPFIIGTNEKQSNISDDLWSMFTYSLVLTCPNLEERKRTLLWLLSAYLEVQLNPECSYYKDICDILNIVSHRTAGFYFRDLEQYVLRIQRCLVERVVQLDGNKEKNNLPSYEDFMKVLDELQEQRSEALGLPRIPKVEWKEVGGLEGAKKELINTIQLPIKHPTLIPKSFRRSGILLYGPPGTGKTLLAKSVASECGLNFLSVKGPELINMYIGQSEENVRNVFAKAKSASPCVIFFDELDSLAPSRGRAGDSGGVMDRIVSALLAELDGVSTASDVFVLAATNRPDLLDEALLRPGRFEKQIYLGLCETREDQMKILKAVTSKLPLDKEASLRRVAESIPFTLTGADFAALASDAFYAAARRLIKSLDGNAQFSAVEVSEADLLDAGANLRPSVTEEELKMYKRMSRKRDSRWKP